MDVSAYVRRLSARPLGRVVLVIAGVSVIYVLLALYPPVGLAIQWAFPVALFLWGGSQMYYYGVNRPLTVIGGCLLMLGGISRAAFQLVPMNELTGAVANLIPFLGIIVEMYAHHYRERD